MACAYLFKIQMSEYYHFHSTDDVLYKNSEVVIPCSFPPIRFICWRKKTFENKKKETIKPAHGILTSFSLCQVIFTTLFKTQFFLHIKNSRYQ